MVSTRRSQLSADTVPLHAQPEADIQSKPEGSASAKASGQVQQTPPRITRSSSRLTSPVPEQPPPQGESGAPKRQLLLEPITEETQALPASDLPHTAAASKSVGPTPQRRSTRSQAAKGGESGASAEGSHAAAGVSGAEGASQESTLPAVTPSRGGRVSGRGKSSSSGEGRIQQQQQQQQQGGSQEQAGESPVPVSQHRVSRSSRARSGTQLGEQQHQQQQQEQQQPQQQQPQEQQEQQLEEQEPVVPSQESQGRAEQPTQVQEAENVLQQQQQQQQRRKEEDGKVRQQQQQQQKRQMEAEKEQQQQQQQSRREEAERVQQQQQQQQDMSDPDDETEASSRSSSGSDLSSSSGNDDSGDEEGGEGLMSKLAASIRSALKVQAGNNAGDSTEAGRGSLGDKKKASSSATGMSKGATMSREEKRGAETAHEGDAQGMETQGEGDELHWRPEIPRPKSRPSQREVLKTRVEGDKEKGLAKQLMVPPRDPVTMNRMRSQGKRKDTAGKGWFDLPAQTIDADMKRELRLLRLRGAYDSKRFYKSFDSTKFPKHFAMGTVIESPADFYSGRLDKKQRKKATLTDQLLADADVSQSRKKRFSKLQEGASAHHKAKAKNKKRASELPRDNKPKKKPKH